MFVPPSAGKICRGANLALTPAGVVTAVTGASVLTQDLLLGQLLQGHHLHQSLHFFVSCVLCNSSSARGSVRRGQDQAAWEWPLGILRAGPADSTQGPWEPRL